MASVVFKLAWAAGTAAVASSAARISAAASRASRAAAASAAHLSGDSAAGLPAGLDVDVVKRKKAKIRLQFDEKDLESDEAIWALYERWCKFHDIQRDHDEMASRFNKFKGNAQLVYKASNSDVPYDLELNRFSDGDRLACGGLNRFSDGNRLACGAQILVGK